MVAGIRTPEDLDTMKNCMPEAYKELVENCEILEKHYKDMMVWNLFLFIDRSFHHCARVISLSFNLNMTAPIFYVSSLF